MPSSSASRIDPANPVGTTENHACARFLAAAIPLVIARRAVDSVTQSPKQMKGIVFTKFLEMVEDTWSSDFADQLVESVDLPSGGSYTAVGTYDHREMVALVTRLSEMSGTPVPDLLKAYGRYLFGQFAILYPGFFEGMGSSLDFVASIESVIHVEVRKLYPDAELPRFDVLEQTPDLLVIRYQSDRHLGDLAEGLLESCIVHFQETGQVELQREDAADGSGAITFTLRRTVGDAR